MLKRPLGMRIIVFLLQIVQCTGFSWFVKLLHSSKYTLLAEAHLVGLRSWKDGKL